MDIIQLFPVTKATNPMKCSCLIVLNCLVNLKDQLWIHLLIKKWRLLSIFIIYPRKKKSIQYIGHQNSFPLNPIRDGGDVQHPPTDTQNGFQMTPNFVTFPISIWSIWKAKTIVLVFHSDFGCLEGGGGKQPPHHLTYIFNPVPNRVNQSFAPFTRPWI